MFISSFLPVSSPVFPPFLRPVPSALVFRPVLLFGISSRVTHCQYSKRLHLVNPFKVPLSGSPSFHLSKLPISALKKGATVLNIVAAKTLEKVRMLHRVETTFYGASFGCSLDLSWGVSAACFLWCFRLCFLCLVFPLWSALLGSAACFLPCLLPCVPVCFLAWFLCRVFLHVSFLCSHRRTEQKRNFIALLYAFAIGIHYRRKARSKVKE